MPGAHEQSTPHAAALDVLRAYLAARAAIGDRDFDVIHASFRHKRLSAGEFLQRAGEITRDTAFVARGCLRSYVIDAKGKEHIVRFAPENW
jgi:CRP-like cAMP-binding protein